MVLQIHVDKIRDLQTRGLLKRIHTTLSTVRALVIAQEHARGQESAKHVLEHAQGMSVCVVVAFLCECGLFQGDEVDMATLKTQVLAQPRHARVCPDVASGLCMEAVLRHVTCLAVCGEMHREATQRTWAAPSSASTALGCVNWRSWKSLEKCTRLGEVIRLSFVLEDNMKRRCILSDECIAEVVHDVVTQVHTVVVQMKCADSQTMVTTAKQHENDATCSNPEPFGKMVRRLMIEVIVAGILRTDDKVRANDVYGRLRVNLLDLFGVQYMQWRSKRGQGPTHAETCRIQDKKKLMLRTIRQHGRQMVYEQVQKMVTIVSGLMSVSPDMQACTELQHSQMQKRLAMLCPGMMQELCECMQRQHTEDTGIHLLRHTAPNNAVQRASPCSQSYVNATSLSTMLQMNSVVSFVFDSDKVTDMRTLGDGYKKLPSNLYQVLQNFGPVLSIDTPLRDPRQGLIQSFREYLAIAYLEIIHSLWASA